LARHTQNAHSLDWAVPDVNKPELLAKYSTPAVWEEAKASPASIS